ncbi:MAG: radical SAM protein [Candidatus Omnitrophota bacterium]|nr:radical SAM protein [Candidatus Omnitrophota bacterium]
MKILLIYPNCEGYGRIPIGISIISACLKAKKHEVELFDSTFMVSRNIDNETREAIGTAKKVDTRAYWGPMGAADADVELRNKIGNFKPELIGITLIQNNYWAGAELLRTVRNISGAHIVAGGIFAAVAPESLLIEGLVDTVIAGEGEEAVVELADCLVSREDIRGIKNLVYLVNGKVQRNPIRAYADLDKIPFQDMSIFDGRHFLKPFDGKMVRAGYFELTRGCPFSCAYCANYFLNEKLYAASVGHIRFRGPDYSIDEIKAAQRLYKFNFIFFADENMLVLPLEKVRRYAALWKKYINLPFYLTTRVEAATEEKIKILKEMGCATIAFGIECGNERFRRKVLNRDTTNEQIINAFKLCRKHGIRTTANNMFGFPYETEDLVFDTIKLNIEANPDSYSLGIFAPYIGTRLHEICVREGYIGSGIPRRISIIDESILNMPQLSKERIRELYADFVKYVSGEMPISEKIGAGL